jgi:hypothetical protein
MPVMVNITAPATATTMTSHKGHIVELSQQFAAH